MHAVRLMEEDLDAKLGKETGERLSRAEEFLEKLKSIKS